MRHTYVRKKLREKVAQQARYRCGYCLSPELLTGRPMDIEHIVPVALGGLTQEDNLWLACSLCNTTKNDRISANDSLTGKRVGLFNPRQQVWREHFEWSEDATYIIGKTAIGRVTIEALQLNRQSLINSRPQWCKTGLFPPQD